MIKKKEVKHIAKLARLGLTEKEIEKFRRELSKILDYIEKLKEVNISKVESTSHLIKLENVMRKDEQSSAPFKTLTDREKLLNLAPKTKNKYLRVKSIL
ncbi:MAG: Asp-tRNA(Asn)/Glu-tRNA(Gln) amidotransferase subunit GatC [Candidatus Nealsonbacteria bacterium]|nr:Asp-tRNA(Asn)/Glu-tRNA(Gln) amidotransferase subunit GatC [Candidatus Nealsonbacteria bacterium]